MPTSEEELAFSITWHALKEAGGEAPYTALRFKYLQMAEGIRDEYGVDIYGLFEETLNHFVIDPKTGLYVLPQVLEEPRSPELLAQELVKEAKVAAGPPEEIMRSARLFQAMRERMTVIDRHLMRWKNSPRQVVDELALSLNKDFFTKHSNPAAMFEFITAKAFSALFQVPLRVEYRAPLTKGIKESVIWRGKAVYGEKLKVFEATNHAPGGGSDIMISPRGGYFVLAEATLRYTRSQWREEVEPIFRHATEFVEKNNLDPENVYLVFITPRNVLDETYKWLHARAREFRVLALDVENLSDLVNASIFVAGLPHAVIRRLFSRLCRRVFEDVMVETYVDHQTDEVKKWCQDVLCPYIDIFLAMKSYEILLRKIGPERIGDVIGGLSSSDEVREYVKLSGLAKENRIGSFLSLKRPDLISYLQLFGLAREVDVFLQELPWEEFDNRILKMYGYVERIWRNRAKK